MAGILGVIAALGTSGGGGGSPGYTTVTASQDTPENTQFVYEQPITPAQAGMCTKLGVFIHTFFSSTTLKVALFDAAGNLISNGTAAISADGWVDATVAASAVTMTPYRLQWAIPTGNVFQAYEAVDGGAGADFSTSYASFPTDPSGTVTPLGATYSVRMYIEP